MNILQLSPQFPFPADDGGRIGIANITKEFARSGASVTLFTLGEKPDENALSLVVPYAKSVHCSHSTKNNIGRIALSAVFPIPLYLWKHTGADITQSLHRILQQKKFDVIHADHSAMMPAAIFAQSIQKIPIGLRLHNIECKIWDRYAQRLTSSLKRSYIQRQARLLRQGEAKFFPKADICFAISDANMAEAQEIAPSANIICASIGIQPDEWQSDSMIQRNTREAILATTYKWIHNVEGVDWLIDKVLPLVHKSIPEASLRLLGKDMPQHFLGKKCVEAQGYVENVKPFLNKAGIYVAPLFVGSGIRIKIIEAMAMELPVVATTVAAEGISAGSEEGLFLADTPEDFARIMIELMTKPEQTRILGAAARQFVIKNFSWKDSVGIMLNEYKKLTEKRQSN